MTLSNLTGIPSIPEKSQATPGLFNTRYAAIDANFATLNAGLFSTGSVVVQSIDSGGAEYNVLAWGSDATSIRSALAHVVTAGGGTVRFPARTYTLDSFYPAATDKILQLTNSGTTVRVALLGAPGAIFTTPISVVTAGSEVDTLRISGNLDDVRIEGIAFISTHPQQKGRNVGISANGGAGNTLRNLSIQHCTFQDHARGIMASGVEGLEVSFNRFLATLGRDSGNSLTGSVGDPNVGLWSFVQSTGQTSNVRVIGNYFDGCVAGTVASATDKMGLDGFVFGAARGWYIAGNVIKRAGVEAIYISHRENSASDSTQRFPAVIVGNVIDCGVPTGGKVQTYGIRSDEHDTTIANNRIHSCMVGIDVTGAGLTSRLTGTKITGNHVTIDSKVTSDAVRGIQVSTADYPVVTDNRVEFLSALTLGSGITHYGQLYFSTHGIVASNNVVYSPQASTTTIFGLWVQQTHSGRFAGNYTENVSHGFTENQHPSNTTGHIVESHAMRNCTNGFTGDIGTLVVRDYDGYLPNGSNVTPSLSFTSENSLGLYRLGAGTIAITSASSLHLGQSRLLSVRTLAASALTLSAALTNTRVDECGFVIGGASGASFWVNSGGTTYIFASTLSAKNA